MLWHLWPQMGKDCPSQGYPILSDNKVLGNTPFTCKLLNPKPKFRTTSSTRWLHSKSQYSSALRHPRARYRQLEAIFRTQSLPTLFKWASPKLLPCSGLPFSRKTQSRFWILLLPHFPCSLSNLVLSHVTLHGMACLLLWGNLRNKNHLSMAFVSPCHHSVTLMNEVLWEQLIQVANAWWVMGEFSRWKGI